MIKEFCVIVKNYRPDTNPLTVMFVIEDSCGIWWRFQFCFTSL